MSQEYGNYEKYEKNSITTEYDDGKEENDLDKFEDRFLNLLRRLPTKEADQMREKRKTEFQNLL